MCSPSSKMDHELLQRSQRLLAWRRSGCTSGCRNARRGSPLFGDPAALALGLALLGLLSLVPVAGPFVWAVASLLGIGAALVAVSRRDALRPVF